MTEEQQKLLMDAAHFALGYIIAKAGTAADGAYFLAHALKACGSESVYVLSIADKSVKAT